MSVLVAVLAGILTLVRLWLLWRSRHQRTFSWWCGWPVALAGILVICLACGLMPSPLVIEKVVGALVEPEGVLWLTLLVLAVLGMLRLGRGWAAALLTVFVLDTLLGNAWVASLLMRSLERQVPSADLSQGFDAVVVLGGGTDCDGFGRAEIGDGGDRVLRGLQLYHQGLTHQLVATGGPIAGMERPHSTGEEAAEIWRSVGVPREAILVLSAPTTTSAEIRTVRQVARERGWMRIGLVTSAWHMPRALRLAEAAGLPVVPIACDYRGMMEPASLVWLIPTGRSRERVQKAVWEYLGALAGR